MWVWSFLFGNLKRVVQVVAVLWLLAVLVVGLGTTWAQRNPEAVADVAVSVAEDLEARDFGSGKKAEDRDLSIHERTARRNAEAAQEAWERESTSSSYDY